MENSLIKQLEELNFTTMEAKVYITLVKNGPLNGSKIAKALNSSRSSVYSTLNNLTMRSIVFPAPGDTNIYKAEVPEILLDRLKRQYTHTAEILKESMATLTHNKQNRDFINIKGMDNILEKSKEIILSGKKEIYINTCIDLQIFKDVLVEVHNRGVRTVVFTYSDLNTEGLPIEIYNNKIKTLSSGDIRIMIVVDMNTTLIASGKCKSNEMTGTFTDNPLLSSIVSEHIHHDIYLLKLKDKYKKDFINEDILIKTLLEKREGERNE